jgi:23S rRNA pseudouridine2457 synthase
MQMQQGLQLTIKGKKYLTKPAVVEIFHKAPPVPERNPPVRFRADLPTPWIKIILHEGKNRQVRKMTALVGFPTLRLIRNRIEKIELNNMQPGDIIELSQKSIYKKLFDGKF